MVGGLTNRHEKLPKTSTDPSSKESKVTAVPTSNNNNTPSLIDLFDVTSVGGGMHSDHNSMLGSDFEYMSDGYGFGFDLDNGPIGPGM